MTDFFKLFKPLLLLSCLLLPAQIFATVVVIGDPNFKGLDQNTLKRLYLGKESAFQGKTVELADLPGGNAVRDEFYQKLTNKKPQQIKAYWAKLVFSGRATPPHELSDDKSVVEWVMASPGRLGYVGNLPDNMKPLLIIE